MTRHARLVLLLIAVMGAWGHATEKARRWEAFPGWTLFGNEGDFYYASELYFDRHGLQLKDYREIIRPETERQNHWRVRFRLDQPGSYLYVGWGKDDEPSPFLRLGSAEDHPNSVLTYQHRDATQRKDIVSRLTLEHGVWHDLEIQCDSACHAICDGQPLAELPDDLPQRGPWRLGAGLRPIHIANVEGDGATPLEHRFQQPPKDWGFFKTFLASLLGFALAVAFANFLLAPWAWRPERMRNTVAPVWPVALAWAVTGWTASPLITVAAWVLGIGTALVWLLGLLAKPVEEHWHPSRLSGLARLLLTAALLVLTAKAMMAVRQWRLTPVGLNGPTPAVSEIADTITVTPTRPWTPGADWTEWSDFTWTGEVRVQPDSMWEWRFRQNHCNARGEYCRHGYSTFASTYEGTGFGLAECWVHDFEIKANFLGVMPSNEWVPFQIKADGGIWWAEWGQNQSVGNAHNTWGLLDFPSGSFQVFVNQGGVELRNQRFEPGRRDHSASPYSAAWLLVPLLGVFWYARKLRAVLPPAATRRLRSLFVTVALAAPLFALSLQGDARHVFSPLGLVAPVFAVQWLLARWMMGWRLRWKPQAWGPWLMSPLAIWALVELGWKTTGLGRVVASQAATSMLTDTPTGDPVFSIVSEPLYRGFNSFFVDGTLRFRPVGEKKPGTLRVLTLGGSSTFGTGLPREGASDFAGQLSQAAGELGSAPMEGLNGGSSQAGAFKMLGLWESIYDEAFQPDVVVLNTGYNDSVRSKIRSAPPALMDIRDSRVPPDPGWHRSRLFGLVLTWMRDQRAYAGPEAIETNYEAVLREFIAAARQRQRCLLFSTEPLAPDFVWENLPTDRLHEIMRRLGQAENVPVLDLRREMMKHPDNRWFLDIVHPNAEGHRQIARWVAGAVDAACVGDAKQSRSPAP